MDITKIYRFASYNVLSLDAACNIRSIHSYTQPIASIGPMGYTIYITCMGQVSVTTANKAQKFSDYINSFSMRKRILTKGKITHRNESIQGNNNEWEPKTEKEERSTISLNFDESTNDKYWGTFCTKIHKSKTHWTWQTLNSKRANWHICSESDDDQSEKTNSILTKSIDFVVFFSLHFLLCFVSSFGYGFRSKFVGLLFFISLSHQT